MTSAQLLKADSGRSEAEVRALRPRWHPARLMRGDVVLATVEWDDESAFWNARCYTVDSCMPVLGTYNDTYFEAVASAEKMVREHCK